MARWQLKRKARQVSGNRPKKSKTRAGKSPKRVAGPEAVVVGEGRAEGVELLTFTTCSLVLRQ